MKAPERVWENLSSKLKKERRRFGTGLSGFLLLVGLLGYLAVSTTAKQALPTKQSSSSSHKTVASPAEKRKATSTNSILPLNNKPVSGESNKIALRNRITETNTLLAEPENRTGQISPTESSSLPTQNDFIPTPVDDYPASADIIQAEQAPMAKPAFLSQHDALPWSIENLTNSYKRKSSRFRTEFHFTPTISYRKLSENKTYLRNASLLNSSPNYAALYGSVNNMVTHKPDLGFELGITEKYSLTEKVRVRGGLQFNVNRYDIKAFRSPYALATIALNRRGSARVDSVYTLSSYSNVDASSNKSNWLQNLSFQISAPVGVELALKSNDKMQFGIATTVQPTYVLGDRAYLITTDYKNYTQVPWLLRRWNVNTAFETFVSYQSGKTRWQVGPQVRYQLLSSFISNYPVKENLFDFGLKIGVSVNK